MSLLTYETERSNCARRWCSGRDEFALECTSAHVSHASQVGLVGRGTSVHRVEARPGTPFRMGVFPRRLGRSPELPWRPRSGDRRGRQHTRRHEYLGLGAHRRLVTAAGRPPQAHRIAQAAG